MALVEVKVPDIGDFEEVAVIELLAQPGATIKPEQSLITYPKLQTHAHIPAETLDRLGIDDTLLRLSVGIEHADDLIRDLQQALEKAQEQAGASIRAQRVP